MSSLVFRTDGSDNEDIRQQLASIPERRWRSVKDALPSVHRTVLAITRAFPEVIRLAQMASCDGVMWRFCDMDDDDVDDFGITHWMPLPSPPPKDAE